MIGGGDAVINKDGGYMAGMGRVKLFIRPEPFDLTNSLRNYVNTAHRYNCLAFVQLVCDGAPTGDGPFGPSAIRYPYGFEEEANINYEIKPLTTEEEDFIKKKINEYAYAVRGVLEDYPRAHGLRD